MKKILYSIETSRYRDMEKRSPMNNITTPPSIHPRPRFLSYSVMPVLFSLLAGLFILSACEEETAAPKKDRPPAIDSLILHTVSVAIGETTNITVMASDPDPDETPSLSLVNPPTFVTITDNGDGTATINITPLVSDASLLGDHKITISATSGALSAGISFTLTITERDTDRDGTVDRLDDDDDNDNILDTLDVDDDNDGLIEIKTLEDLHNIRHNLAGTSYKTNAPDPGDTSGAPGSGLNGYELVRDLDFNDPASYASGVVNTNWTTRSGWLPIGDNSTENNSTQFTGILEGNGHKIANLIIMRDTEYVGLFGYIGRGGQVRNLGIENGVADYTGNSDENNLIGLLAGWSDGTIIAVHTSGRADGGNGDFDRVGGLVGLNNNGTITACYATGTADGGNGTSDYVGGFVGQNFKGTITACYATGNADGRDGDSDLVGGLVGWNNNGRITACYATGNADGGDGGGDNVGGLVGWNNNSGTIRVCYATGMADGGDGFDNVGGLVGRNNQGTITACYATGNVGGDNVGGLVGLNDNDGTITACYATGNANGEDGSNDGVGGLVGQNFATITACYATGMADGGDGNDDVGGLVGFNNNGTITACYATGNADGGDGANDRVGGLVGNNVGTITACYATGNANGGDGRFGHVGGLVGLNNNSTITASYGFGTVTREEMAGVDRSGDASDSTTVGSASELTMANSSTIETNKWSARVWDFGTDSQDPVLKWITGYNRRGATDEAKYPCDVALLPDGRECGDIIPGQGR